MRSCGSQLCRSKSARSRASSPGSCRETGGEYLGGFFRGVLIAVPERQIVPEYLQRGLNHRVSFPVRKSWIFGGVGDEISKGDEQFDGPVVCLEVFWSGIVQKLFVLKASQALNGSAPVFGVGAKFVREPLEGALQKVRGRKDPLFVHDGD